VISLNEATVIMWYRVFCWEAGAELTLAGHAAITASRRHAGKRKFAR